MYKRILVPLDGSTLAEAILPQVERLSRGEDVSITLVRAVDLPPEIRERVDVAATLREQAQRYVQNMRTVLSAKFKFVTGHVHDGDAAAIIVDVAAEMGADLIAMTTHGYSGMSRWFFGSVAERVLRSSKTPVLMMKSFEEGGIEASAPAKAEIRRILVPLDGSKDAEQVLPHARELSRRFDAEVALLYVIEPQAYGSRITAFEGGHYLAQLVEKLRAEGDRVIPATSIGHPADEIVTFARDNGIDLIAMTTHGRRGVSRWWLGSVAEKVIRTMARPILLVRLQAGAK